MALFSNKIDPQNKAFNYAGFRYIWLATLANTLAVQIMSVAVGWQVYDLTGNPLYLGYVGLVQFLPSFALVLVTGWVADRFSRRAVIIICIGFELAGAIGLFLLVEHGESALAGIFVALFVLGLARAFLQPARQSLVPNLVPQKALGNALALHSSAWQMGGILGPVAGGLLYGISGQTAYLTAAGLCVAAAVFTKLVPPPERDPSQRKATSVKTILAGFSYIWNHKVILGAISLDLFAVLLGGATALLPVYARDILVVGPWGLGLLRAAPGVGAIVAAIIISQIPIRKNAGILLFIFVALFGLFTTLFALSTSVWWSILCLMLLGAFDMVSVVVRETVMQLWTPDEVRGRVSAVNSVFIGASNELGEFRAGVMAAFIGAKWAVALGGVGTIAVAGIWSRIFPQLREVKSLEKSGH